MLGKIRKIGNTIIFFRIFKGIPGYEKEIQASGLSMIFPDTVSPCQHIITTVNLYQIKEKTNYLRNK